MRPDRRQSRGVLANSALVQPIVPPFLTEERMREFFAILQTNNIINFKPEFLTVCMENLAWTGQLLGHEAGVVYTALGGDKAAVVIASRCLVPMLSGKSPPPRRRRLSG